MKNLFQLKSMTVEFTPELNSLADHLHHSLTKVGGMLMIYFLICTIVFRVYSALALGKSPLVEVQSVLLEFAMRIAFLASFMIVVHYIDDVVVGWVDFIKQAKEESVMKTVVAKNESMSFFDYWNPSRWIFCIKGWIIESVARGLISKLILIFRDLYLYFWFFIHPVVASFSMVPLFRGNITLYISKVVPVLFWSPLLAIVDAIVKACTLSGDVKGTLISIAALYIYIQVPQVAAVCCNASGNVPGFGSMVRAGVALASGGAGAVAKGAGASTAISAARKVSKMVTSPPTS